MPPIELDLPDAEPSHDPSALGMDEPAPASSGSISMQDFEKFKQEQQEAYTKLQQTNLDLMNTMNGVIAQQQNNPTQRAASRDFITEDDVRHMIETGEGGGKLIEGINKTIESRLAEFHRTNIEPIRQQGSSAISSLALQQARGLPYFTEFEADIKKQLDALHPDLKSNPDMVKKVHAMVVGENIDKIQKFEREKFLRQQQEPEGAASSASTSRAQSKNKIQIKTPEELFNASSLAKLQYQGITPEQLAKRQGFSSWEEYSWASDHPNEEFPIRKGAV